MEPICGDKHGFSLDSDLSDQRKFISTQSMQKMIAEIPVAATDNGSVSANQMCSVLLTDNNEESKRDQLANMKNPNQRVVRYRSSEKQLEKGLKKSVVCLSVQKYGTPNFKIDSNSKKNYEVQNSKLKVF